jgi:hypothetical protein
MTCIAQCRPRAALALATLLIVSGPAPAAETFPEPRMKNIRVDYCKYWANSCGQEAADNFCREMGYGRSPRFSRAKNLGRFGVPTLVLGDGRLCMHPTCSGFSAITCE